MKAIPNAIVFLVSLITSASLSVASSSLCSSLDLEQLSPIAVKYLKSSKLIKPDEINWKLIAVTENRDTCFGILTQGPNFDLLSASVNLIEFVVINPSTQQINTVENTFKNELPRSLRVGVGYPLSTVTLESPHYYWEFTGESATAIYKTILAKIPYAGFTGCVDLKNIVENDHSLLSAKATGKLQWDPTPKRNWKLRYANFSLRRGVTNEVDDIQPNQLDGDLFAIVSGSNVCKDEFVPKTMWQARGHVAPWGSPFPRTVFLNNRWQLIDYAANIVDDPSVNQPTHELTLRDNQDATECQQTIQQKFNALKIKFSHLRKIFAGPPGSETIMGFSIVLHKRLTKLEMSDLLNQVQCLDSIVPL